MAFTDLGLLEQRLDFYEDITKIELFGLESELLCEIVKANFTIVEGQEGNIIFNFSVLGSEVGVGNTVDSYKIYKADKVLYIKEFTDKNVCITNDDTFNFTISIGN